MTRVEVEVEMNTSRALALRAMIASEGSAVFVCRRNRRVAVIYLEECIRYSMEALPSRLEPVVCVPGKRLVTVLQVVVLALYFSTFRGI